MHCNSPEFLSECIDRCCSFNWDEFKDAFLREFYHTCLTAKAQHAN